MLLRVVALMVVSVSVAVLPLRLLEAQRTVASVDVSGMSVWYSDSLLSRGGSISPALRLDWARATLGASADISRLGQGGISAQGSLAPSIFTPSFGMFTGEVAGAIGGSTHEGGARTGQMLMVARLYAMRAASGGWVGAGGGRSSDGVRWRQVKQAEIGGWLEHGGVTSLATISPVVVEDTVRYTDFRVAARYPRGVFEVGASAGARSGAVGSAVGGTSRTWGSVSVLSWLNQRVAVVMNAGAYPVDLTQGYPGGRFATLALRFGSRPTRTGEAGANSRGWEVAPASDGEARKAGIMAFDVTTVRGTQRIVRVHAPTAQSVELTGDFTHWQPVQLVRGSNGWWSVTHAIAAGTHELNVRINKGDWLAPPGLVATRDEFGGVSGILTVQ